MDLELALRLLLASVAMIGAAAVWRRSRSEAARSRAGEAFARQHGTSVSARMAPLVDAAWRRRLRRAALGLGVIAALVLVLPPWTNRDGLVLACLAVAAAGMSSVLAITWDLARSAADQTAATASRDLSVDDYVAPWRRHLAATVMVVAAAAIVWSRVQTADPRSLALLLSWAVLVAAFVAFVVAMSRALREEASEGEVDRFVLDALRAEHARYGYAVVGYAGSALALGALALLSRTQVEFPFTVAVVWLLFVGPSAMLRGLGPENQLGGTPRFRRRLWPHRELVYSTPVLRWRP